MSWIEKGVMGTLPGWAMVRWWPWRGFQIERLIFMCRDDFQEIPKYLRYRLWIAWYNRYRYSATLKFKILLCGQVSNTYNNNCIARLLILTSCLVLLDGLSQKVDCAKNTDPFIRVIYPAFFHQLDKLLLSKAPFSPSRINICELSVY